MATTRFALAGIARTPYPGFTAKEYSNVAWSTDTLTSQNGDTYIVNWTGIADASDLADQVIVDISTLTKSDTTTPTYTEILELKASAGGCSGLLEWDHTADDAIMAIPDGAPVELPAMHPTDRANVFTDPRTSGGTGDIVLTTTGGGVGDSIQLYLKVLLK